MAEEHGDLTMIVLGFGENDFGGAITILAHRSYNSCASLHGRLAGAESVSARRKPGEGISRAFESHVAVIYLAGLRRRKRVSPLSAKTARLAGSGAAASEA